MEHEDDVNRELIKCVVVGDTAVGKTRLICAKACGQKLSLEQLMTVHVPTVWAIDQYRICKDVLQKSFEVIDGINVSLRLWDTFGDHNNDRCFAYGRADVVMLCFSVASQRSLENARTVWYPEIRRMCPNVPVLLVACKVDLRHFCLQPEFQQLLARRRPAPLKPVRPDHIVLPEHGRSVANEIGAFYYETSVCNHFGIEDVYTNAVRAALCRRRQARLWLGSTFQSVRYPQIQCPFQPPKPEQPSISVLHSQFLRDVSTCLGLSDCNNFYDCVLRVKEKMFYCHRLMLASGSKFFRNLFVCTTPHCVLCSDTQSTLIIDDNCNSEPSRQQMREIEFNLFRTHLNNGINNNSHNVNGHSKRLSICSGGNNNRQSNRRSGVVECPNGAGVPNEPKTRLSSTDSLKSTNSTNRKLLPPAIQHARYLNEMQTFPEPILSVTVDEDQQFVVVQLDCKKLKPRAVHACLQFMYSGDLPFTVDGCNHSSDFFDEVVVAGEYFEMKHLIVHCTNHRKADDRNADSVYREYLDERNSHLAELGFELSLFCDAEFITDAYVMPVHKFILSARSEMMRAMFSNKFKESCTSQVQLPGVCPEVLYILLHYFYYDSLNFFGHLTVGDYVEALELANRMCLSRLTNLLECDFVSYLEELFIDDETRIDDILYVLEPAKMCNAKQLSNWCLTFLSCNYQRLLERHSKQLKSLTVVNQDYLTVHRWPPVWYIKEMDYYERALKDGQKAAELVAAKLFKRNKANSGCLCFTARSSSSRHQHNSV